MKLTEQDVRHVAELANLALSDDEIARMAHDLEGILTHIDKLNELDTSNVEPMVARCAASAQRYRNRGAVSRPASDDVERTSARH